MRRVNTYSSSGSQKAYNGFAFASQNPAGPSTGTGYRPAYTGATGLPTKQKPFKPPFKPRTKSTLSLLEGFDFEKGEPAATTGKPAATGSSFTGVGQSPATSGPRLHSDPKVSASSSGFRYNAISRSTSTGSNTTIPESLSAPTSSSDTLSSGGETPPLTTADTSSSSSVMSPAVLATTAATAFTSANDKGSQGDDDDLLLDDPNDSSFGDVEWDLNLDDVGDMIL
ncbi:hypothetical protein NMY22_g7076 [Coprinellus aureogranulatus]|nr:hypothetical protein NMY22_g7076 [Coprinellus aureogranulatus]